jgi:hypothetical protein
VVGAADTGNLRLLRAPLLWRVAVAVPVVVMAGILGLAAVHLMRAVLAAQ